eukprot:c20672_g1_i1 orf=206-1249(-)
MLVLGAMSRFSYDDNIGSIVEPLIPGLPDDLALQCLAKISHGYHGVLQAVCKRWQRLIGSQTYIRAQAQEGRCGDWLFVLTEETKDGRWNAYDPAADRWHFLPRVPDIRSRQHHHGFACTGVGKKLLVMGGYYTSNDTVTQPVKFYATNEVLQFDPFTKQWSRVASMRVARCNFACAVIGGKVYVAGGCSSSRSNPLADAEVYDSATDKWQDLPPLPSAREDCVGVNLGGLFYVVAGVVDNHISQKQAEVFDPERSVWYSIWDMWLFARQMPCPVTAVDGCIYALDDWDANYIKAWKPYGMGWEKLGPVPPVHLQGRFSELVWKHIRPMGESRGAVLGCAVIQEDNY